MPPPASSNSAPLQVGVISSGGSLGPLVSELRRVGLGVIALWSPDASVAIQTAAENEIPFVAGQPDDVLLRKEVGMVLVATTPALQAPLCDKALGIGKHVLCLPPAAIGKDQASAILSAASYYPSIRALVGFGLRHLHTTQALRQALRGGRVGQVCAVEVNVRCGPLFSPSDFDWGWESGMGGGVLQCLAVHYIDLLSFVLGARAQRVQGLVRTHGAGQDKKGFRSLQAENWASFLLEFPAKTTATLTLSSLGPSASFASSLAVVGAEGRLVVEERGGEGKGGGEGRLVEERNGLPAKVLAEERGEGVALAWRSPGDVPPLFGRGLSKLLADLAAGTTKTMATFQDAAYAQAVIAAVREASDSTNSVRILI